MRTTDSRRYALSFCALVVVFTGCGGGSGTSPNPPTAGSAALQTRVNPDYGVIYSFKGYPFDGADPQSGLINVKGTLYGTTQRGGSGPCYSGSGCGTVYAIAPSGGETPLYGFKGEPSDGAAPNAGLVNVNGTLYGTTSEGGSYCTSAGGCGTVFSITRSGKETVLYSFKGGHSGDGAIPNAGLVNLNGTLYGTTEFGGQGFGTVFAVTTLGAETVIHNFDGQDGTLVHAGLANVNGTLYGTASGGGTSNDGVVFAITPSGTETVLHSFTGYPTDGSSPYSGLINYKGILYGTTQFGGSYCPSLGCGTVFAITTTGTETVLHSFGGPPNDGSYVSAGLVSVKGMLYGATVDGGDQRCSCGTVFSVTTSGTETVLHSFAGGKLGKNPWTNLFYENGELYGDTYKGGTQDDGTVYTIKTKR